jgi:hypothetical protein
MPGPEVPNNPLVEAANKLLNVPADAEKIREMHADKTPLVQMVVDLGLAADLSSGIRQIVEGLSPEVVEEIRTATLDMLNGSAPEKEMPLNCTVTVKQINTSVPVVVEVLPEPAGPTIHVRPAKIGSGG